MSEERFDELSKALATTISRRQALKLAGATALGGVLAMMGAGRASAQFGGPGRCRKVGAICRQHSECCDFYCDRVTGRCGCPPGSFLCPGGPGRSGSRCVFCPPEATFDPETCTCTCPAGTTQCEGFYGVECCPAGVACCPGGFCDFYGYGC